jgi:predicted XRE-type DNA-binding protein
MNAKEHDSPGLRELLEEATALELAQTKVKMQLAANIEELMRSKGWTKTRFAAELHKSQPEVSKWLSGAHNFTIDTLCHIALVLGTDVPALCGKPPIKVVYRADLIVASSNPPAVSGQIKTPVSDVFFPV